MVPEVKNIAAVVMNGEEEEDEFVAPSATWTPEKEVVVSSEYLSPAEKPLVSERFGHRKPAKASPEGTILLILFFVLNSCLLIICVFLEFYEVSFRFVYLPIGQNSFQIWRLSLPHSATFPNFHSEKEKL